MCCQNTQYTVRRTFSQRSRHRRPPQCLADDSGTSSAPRSRRWLKQVQASPLHTVTFCIPVMTTTVVSQGTVDVLVGRVNLATHHQPPEIFRISPPKSTSPPPTSVLQVGGGYMTVTGSAFACLNAPDFRPPRRPASCRFFLISTPRAICSSSFGRCQVACFTVKGDFQS